MTHLLISALLPLVVATTCPEGSDSCSSSSQALLQSSMSHQIGMDDASEGGLKPLLLMFQQGGARWGRGDGQGLKDSSKSEHLLGQLETRVGAAALDNKRLSPLEGSLMKALNETIENTTLPALKKGHEDDQKEMNRTVQALANCNDNFATDSKKAASARQMVDALKDTHRQCRGNQSKLKGVRAENMKDLKSFVDNLQQPQKPASLAPTAADSYFAAGMKWFKENQATYAQKKVAYTAAKEEHDNKTDICNAAQTRYESGYCQWVGQGSAASKSYTRCWQQGSGNDWKQIRATVLDSAEQRKHEYVAAKKIQCFLSSLLILFSKAGAVTKQNISACKVLMPDTSIFDLVNTDAPPKKSVASLGNLTSMPGDGVWQHSEYAAISGVKNITPCAKALDDNDTLIWKDGNMSHYCNADEKVLMHRCLACEAGKSSVREDALGPDTNCSAIICDADEHVVSNSCTSCSPGKVRLEGDDASGADTACEHVTCKANQCVQGNECIACDPGRTRGAGDKASGLNTSCSPIFCDAGQFVRSHGCHSCPAGHRNDKGDDASGPNTSCEAIKCGSNEHVKHNTCHTCPPGTTNSQGDDASKGDTSCNATKCATHTKVVSNECKGCPPGKTNAADDDASAGDTLCDAKYCSANQYVVNHACTPCADGTTRPAGDDASGRDTRCSPIKCQANQRVRRHACEACPHGTVNAAGDDASGHDTSCDRTTTTTTTQACWTANVPETDRTYSSVWNNDAPGTGHALSMLDSAQAWSAQAKNAGEWMQIDLGSVQYVRGVVVQGRADNDQWVTRFRVRTSADGSSWSDIQTEFVGSTDRSTKVEVAFQSASSARFVQFVVQSWNDHISMRAGVQVCKATYTYMQVGVAGSGYCAGGYLRFSPEVSASSCQQLCTNEADCQFVSLGDLARGGRCSMYDASNCAANTLSAGYCGGTPCDYTTWQKIQATATSSTTLMRPQ